MFDFIKNTSSSYIFDLIAENSTASGDNIKDIFLNDPDALAITAENDPEINDFISKIPEDSEGEELTDKDIDDIAESMIAEEASLIGSGEYDTSISDRITSGGYDPDYDEWANSYSSCDDDEYDETYSDESDDCITDRITSESHVFETYDDYDDVVGNSNSSDYDDVDEAFHVEDDFWY